MIAMSVIDSVSGRRGIADGCCGQAFQALSCVAVVSTEPEMNDLRSRRRGNPARFLGI
jgi:hypothetical protein